MPYGGYCFRAVERRFFMKKRKSTYELMKEIRKSWDINPRTRVQDNELKNKKKRRQEEKKIVREDGQ
jgi:hypothetical protein